MKLRYLILILTLIGGLGSEEWVEITQEDFRDGGYECNLYVSYRGGGTIEFAPRFDFNDDGYLDLFVANWEGHIYWGSAQGFSEDNCLILPHGYGGCSGADLNNDGFTDLVLSPCKRYHNWIFWGSSGGFKTDDTTCLAGSNDANESNFIADLNRDGYLDIVASADYDHGSIYWGSKDGYSTDNRTDLPAYAAALNVEVADFNKDGWLDAIFVNPWGGNQYIYFGSASGFDSTNRTILQYPPSGGISPHGCSVADFNRDGWLDIVFTGYQNITQAQIFWGSPQGFRQFNSQLLDVGAWDFGGSYIIDFNKDGYLDIVVFRNNNVSPLVFWGSLTGYSSSNASEIGSPLNAASGGCIADYNQDGEWDVFVLDFSGTSKLFWGPDYIAQDIPPSGHHGQTREIGNVYNRKYEEEYFSSVYDAGNIFHWGVVSWNANTPSETEIRLAVRMGNTPSPGASWSDWINILSNPGPIPETFNFRYAQYRTTFKYKNPSYLPSLEEVRITYGLHDVASITLIQPKDSIFVNNYYVPKATVKNYGLIADTFKVKCIIKSQGKVIYSDVEEILGLPSSAKCQVTFNEWVPAQANTYTFYISTQLTDDVNPFNDTLSKTFTAISADVGVESIDIPTDTITPNISYHPEATVKNYGMLKCNFDVTCKIEYENKEMYKDTKTIADLTPNATQKVVFNEWIPLKGESYTVTVYTIFFYDSDHSNDTLTRTTFVGIAESKNLPKVYELSQIVPNPMYNSTTIYYQLPKSTPVSLKIYDATGRLMKTLISEYQEAGYKSVSWKGRDTFNRRISQGIYFIHFNTPEYQTTKKILVLGD